MASRRGVQSRASTALVIRGNILTFVASRNSMNLSRFLFCAARDASVRAVRPFSIVLALSCAMPLGRLAAADAPNAAPVIAQPLPTPQGQENPPPLPSLQHVWIPGFWQWRQGGYRWVAGHWELPPTENANWVAPRWEQQSNGFTLVEGGWQTGAPAPAAGNVAADSNAPTPVNASAPDAGAPVAANAPATQPQAPVASASATGQPPPPGPTEVVEMAPPPPTTEVIYARPGPGYRWVGGYWAWSHGRHVWVEGHWVLPPQSNMVWVAPRWERRGGGYVLIDGYWRQADVAVGGPPPPPQAGPGGPPPGGEIVVQAGPPPPRREFVGPRPGPYYSWVGGYWRWNNGRYVWIDGHWEIPPRGRSWAEPRWEHRGNGYVFVEGGWR